MMGMLNTILTALDISDQVERGLGLVRTITNPIASFLLAAILTAINIILWPWIWYFDIDATREFGAAHARMIQQMPVPVPVPDPALVGLLLAGGLLLPTLVEMGAPVLSRYGVAIAGWLFWICVAVDAYTDYPRVAAFLEPYAPTGGWWQVPFFFVARMVLLFFATLGLEFWFAVASVLVLALILRGLSLSAGGGRRRRRAA
jgi:hypothetical protein